MKVAKIIFINKAENVTNLLNNQHIQTTQQVDEGKRATHQREVVTKRYAANVSHAWDGYAIVSQAFINQMVRIRMAGPLICERWAPQKR